MDRTTLLTSAPPSQKTPAGRPVASVESQHPEPAESDLRKFATTEVSAFFTDKLARHEDEWRHALDSVKAALTVVATRCEAGLSKLTENQGQLSGAVSALVERLVAAGTAEAEAAAELARHEAQLEITRLKGLVDSLHAERQTDRDELKTALELVDEAQTGRANAEAACEAAEAVSRDAAAAGRLQVQAALTALEAERVQVAHLKQALEAEQSVRTKLAAALETVQRAITFAGPPQAASGAVTAPVRREDNEHRESPVPKPAAAADGRTVDPATAGPVAPPTATSVATSAPAVEGSPAANRVLKLVSSPRQTDTAAQAEATEYIKQLLDEIEAIYWADVRSAVGATDVVDRLAANLRYARDAYTRRLGSGDDDDMTLFDQQITQLLDSKAETSFGRHLAIAAYDATPSPAKTAPFGVE